MYWWQAISENDSRVIKHINRFKDCRDNRGLTSLHVAAEVGHTRLVNAFLHAGLDVNDRFPETPLLYAVKNNNYGVVLLLLRSNAKIPTTWNAMKFSLDTRMLITSCRCGRKWRLWTQKRRRERERQWTKIVWFKKNISCDLTLMLQLF